MKKVDILVLTLVIIVIGCANSNNKGTTGEKKVNLQMTEPSEAPTITSDSATTAPSIKPKNAKVEKLESKIEDTGLRQISMNDDNGGCSTENGFYYISTTMINDYLCPLISYVDYNKMESSYLCNKSDCDHTTHECISNIWEEKGLNGGLLFTDKKYVYLLINYIGTDGSFLTRPASASSETGSVLYRMNLDGSHKTKIYEFDTGESVSSKIFYDGKNFVMLVEKLKEVPIDNETAYIQAESKELITLSAKSHKRKTIKDIDKDMRLVGCADDYLVFAKEEFEQKYDSLKFSFNEAQKKEAMKGQTISIFKLDYSTKKQSAVIQIIGVGKKSYTLANHSLYYGIENSGEIKEVNIKSGEEKTLGKTEDEKIIGHTNEVLICEAYTAVAGNMGMLMSLQTGDTKERTLSMGARTTPVSILNSHMNKYLVQRGYDNSNIPIYSFISIANYMDQEEQFEDFKVNSNGKKIDPITPMETYEG